jgi:hypothetical protein
MLDMYHEINVIAEADGEAQVSGIEIDGDTAYVELDCGAVTLDLCAICGAPVDTLSGEYLVADGGGLICQECIDLAFEKMLDMYHEINVIAEADGEAQVSGIEIE